MKRFAALACAAVLALLPSACNQPANTHDADVQAIRDTETQWNQDYAQKDLDKAISHYADDAVLMVGGSPAISGKDAIHNAMKQMLADPAFSLKFQASKIDVAKSGDLAYTQGSYTLSITDPQTKQVVNDHGSYVTAYRKQADGTWKAVTDMAASEVPPPAPAPAPAPKKKH
jgi:uncharacterized protein (TIGR02246 family)